MGSHQTELNFYKKFAPKYDERNSSFAAQLYYDYWDRLMINFVSWQDNIKVLDLGCGTGDFLEKLQKKYKRVAGVDISPEMLKIAQKKYPHLSKNLIRSVAEKLHFEDKSIDIVFIRGALHHFQNPVQSLKEIQRVLKRNGWLIFLEPCSDFFILRFLRNLLFKFKSDKFLSEHRSFSKKELEEMLFETSFQIRSYRRLGLIAYPLCARPDIFPFINYLPAKKYIVNLLIKLDEFIIKFIFRDKLSLLIIFYAQKK